MQLFILLYIEGGSYIKEEEEEWEFVVLYVSFTPPFSYSSGLFFSKTRPTTTCHYYIVLTHPTHHSSEFYFYDPGTRNDNGNTLPTSGHIISSDIRRSFRSTATPRKSGYESGKKNDPTLCGNL